MSKLTGDAEMLAEFERLALAAGAEIMDVFRAGITVEEKSDHSPVTQADRRAEIVILEGLRKRSRTSLASQRKKLPRD